MTLLLSGFKFHSAGFDLVVAGGCFCLNAFGFVGFCFYLYPLYIFVWGFSLSFSFSWMLTQYAHLDIFGNYRWELAGSRLLCGFCYLFEIFGTSGFWFSGFSFGLLIWFLGFGWGLVLTCCFRVVIATGWNLDFGFYCVFDIVV